MKMALAVAALTLGLSAGASAMDKTAPEKNGSHRQPQSIEALEVANL